MQDVQVKVKVKNLHHALILRIDGSASPTKDMMQLKLFLPCARLSGRHIN
jgi:hypothetical protein